MNAGKKSNQKKCSSVNTFCSSRLHASQHVSNLCLCKLTRASDRLMESVKTVITLQSESASQK